MLCYDLFCGLDGWGEAFLSEGYEVIGYDIMDMAKEIGRPRMPGLKLVLRDVLAIHGREFKNATCIVASPPCQAYSYRAMPWKRAKALPPPDNSLFEACFRIQREASEAAGRHIPMVVENVCGAQKWVGRAKWHFGNFYLWGDVPALMPIIKPRKGNSHPIKGTKNDGGSWFAIGSPGQTVTGQNPDGRKVPGIKLSEVGFNVAAAQRWREQGLKGPKTEWRQNKTRASNRMVATDEFKNHGDWFGSGENCSLQRKASSRSNSRKAASAHIAKIPFPLAQHIARVFKG